MAAFGELEHRVMEVLWDADATLSVRSVHEILQTERDLAYTTVMTVLDRLAKKGQVTRRQEGRAWMYRPAESRASHVASNMLEQVAGAGAAGEEAVAEFLRRLEPQHLEAARRVLTR